MPGAGKTMTWVSRLIAAQRIERKYSGRLTMKKQIIAAMTIFFLAGATTSFARGYDHGYRGHYPVYRPSHHHHGGDGLGIALGVAGGLLLGTALISAVSPPPPAPVVYEYRQPVYQPVVPKICYEDRVISGEWQVSRYDGRQIWVSYPTPVSQRVQVPCY